MYKHLFLEADSGSGKSTLIRDLIKPYIDSIGGFSSQRLLDENGDTIAFRIVSAYDMRLALPYENTPDTIFRTVSKNHRSQNHIEIFDSAGLELLNDTSDKKLILLDEIGGIELKSAGFARKLFEILSGDTPCIGVIKQQKKACFMDKSSCEKEHIEDRNEMLRDRMINEFSCRIIQFKRNDPAVSDEVKAFIENIFD